MSLSVGIVGLPNVGKSTLFNALLKKQAALAANYPFATIEPNVGIVPVPDDRLNKLAAAIQKETGVNPPLVPATVEFLDIAGLVAGASKGEGLGNKFLSHIREVSAIAHVLRAFTDEDIIRAGAVDAKSDFGVIETELQLADLSTIEKQKQPNSSITDKAVHFRWEVVQKLVHGLNSGISAREVLASDEEREIGRELGLLTAKPRLFVLNVDEGDLAKADELRKKYAAELDVDSEDCVVISAKIESELASLSEEEQQVYMADLGVKESGLERLTRVAYHTLGLQSFLTAGEKEVRAWTIKKGATAVEAAGVIHTDFMKKFIKANIASLQDFISLGGWKGVRESGKLKQEGKTYVMQDGDVVEFMIGT
ncbi:MAG TPA: redox-regulated ATPase YchF [Candidatus Saccharimonadia bacterium]|nr:redox-regulated ATPase YchF [Candidatus Saccharimonadia bacterium]